MGFTRNPWDRNDRDGDGICDQVEEALAERFAPVIFMSADEPNLPVSVDWFLHRATLKYFEDCGILNGGDTVEPVPGAANPIGRAGIAGAVYNHPQSWRTQGDPAHPDHHCGSPPEHGPIASNHPDPERFVDHGGDQLHTDGTQETFFLEDLPNTERSGSTDPNDWVTYVHVYPRQGGGVVIQYWHLFSYDSFTVANIGAHGGDWDAAIHVLLDSDLKPERVIFSRHSNDSPGDCFSPNDVHWYQQTHPMVVIDSGGHGAFRDAQESPVPFISDRSGWRDDPDGPGTGYVWKTWPGQMVRADGCRLGPLANHPTPPLVNLGEYNTGVKQGCGLQAPAPGEAPSTRLTDETWLAYSGRWGHPSFGTGVPPRSPIWQGYDPNRNLYTSWYAEGADQAANAATHPWLTPPTLTRQADARGVVTLAARQNPGAAAMGPAQLLYQLSSDTQGWRPYTAPVTVPLHHRLQAIAIDTLNNQSAILTIARDVTLQAPAQPALGRAVEICFSAHDSLTGVPIDGAVSIDSKPVFVDGTVIIGGVSQTVQHHAVRTNETFAWTFPEGQEFPTGVTSTGFLANGPGRRNCYTSHASRWPAASIQFTDGSSWAGQLGPNDPAFDRPQGCVDMPANVPLSTVNKLATWLALNGGDPPSTLVSGLPATLVSQMRNQMTHLNSVTGPEILRSSLGGTGSRINRVIRPAPARIMTSTTTTH